MTSCLVDLIRAALVWLWWGSDIDAPEAGLCRRCSSGRRVAHDPYTLACLVDGCECPADCR